MHNVARVRLLVSSNRATIYNADDRSRVFSLRFNLNITKSLLESVEKTSASWAADFNNNSGSSQLVTRTRVVPYVIRNKTGIPIYFFTMASFVNGYSNCMNNCMDDSG